MAIVTWYAGIEMFNFDGIIRISCQCSSNPAENEWDLMLSWASHGLNDEGSGSLSDDLIVSEVTLHSAHAAVEPQNLPYHGWGLNCFRFYYFRVRCIQCSVFIDRLFGE